MEFFLLRHCTNFIGYVLTSAQVVGQTEEQPTHCWPVLANAYTRPIQGAPKASNLKNYIYTYGQKNNSNHKEALLKRGHFERLEAIL